MTRFAVISALFGTLMLACGGPSGGGGTEPTEEQGEDLTGTHHHSKCSDTGGTCMGSRACDTAVGNHDGYCDGTAGLCSGTKVCYYGG
jgi:hypothetical protein